jgi:hypothetical protein
MAETEAHAIRFNIDHYEPRKARPDLKGAYSNLMWSCDECNTRKGDRCPPPAARAAGERFFRPDEDLYEDHFARTGIRLEAKTKVGDFSIDGLDLNRQGLLRLRRLRERLEKCDAEVLGGVLALRRFPIDQLPPRIRGQAVRNIRQAVSMASQMADAIDALLRENARSQFIDPDPGSEARAKERTAKFRQREALYPGSWRARPESAINRKKRPRNR